MGAEVEKLKPCPFCGAIPDVGIYPETDETPRGYFMVCPACRIEGPLSSDRNAVVTAWNRRAQAEESSANGGWLGIESAPENHAEVFLAHFQGYGPPTWISVGWFDHHGTEGRRWFKNKRGSLLPTHWMPAPPNPRTSAPAEARSAWAPMETAPKDGREVLLTVKRRAGVPGKMLVGHYMPGGHCIEDHPPIEGGWYFWSGGMFDRAAEPTAWMPLPAAPKAEGDHG